MLEAENKKNNTRLVVEFDENVGYYVYIFDRNSNVCLQDLLYDSLEQAQKAIYKRFGIRKEEFKEVKSNQNYSFGETVNQDPKGTT